MFLGAALVSCFFFMEETNYHRQTVGVVETTEVDPVDVAQTGEDIEKIEGKAARVSDSNDNKSAQVGTVEYRSNKTYLQKLSLWQPSAGQDVFNRAFASLKYFSWPVVAFSGFNFGLYVVSGISYNVLAHC